MRRFRVPATILALACLVGLVSLAAVRSGQRATGSPWNDWNTLHLEARMGPFGSGRFEMRLRGDEGKHVVETSSVARFMGLRVGRSRTVSILGPDGRTERYEQYSKERGRRYVFGDTGYTVEKLETENGFEAGPEDWSVYFASEYPYPSKDGRFVRPFDYYALLVHLRDSGLDKPGDETELYVANTDGPRPYRVKIVEARTTERKWVDLATGNERTEPLREFRITIVPSDPGDEDEGFMNMQGQTEIWVEAGSKAPIEINGRVPRVGLVKMKLEAMGSGPR